MSEQVKQMEHENLTKLCFSRKARKIGVKLGDTFINKGKQNLIILGTLVILFLVFLIISPAFGDKYNIVSMTQSVAPYAIMALGVTFVIATGGIDLSIGTVCIASAVIAGKLYMGGMPLWLTIPIMIVIGLLFGIVNGILVAKLKLPAFIATLGTMMFARGISALVVTIPNIFYPNGTWFNKLFSNLNGFPVALIWVFVLMLVGMFVMYKTKIGRYILSIGSNEEATRLSGINTDKYKIMAYAIAGLCAGIAAIFWSASFSTVASATGNGMELDAIAGVYIGGTSAAGGVASILGSIIGSILLVVIRSGLNFSLATFDIQLNSTYLTFAITGVIVVAAVLMDTIKNKRASKVKLLSAVEEFKKELTEQIMYAQNRLDIEISRWRLAKGTLTDAIVAPLNLQRIAAKKDAKAEIKALKAEMTIDKADVDNKIAQVKQTLRDKLAQIQCKQNDALSRITLDMIEAEQSKYKELADKTKAEIATIKLDGEAKIKILKAKEAVHKVEVAEQTATIRMEQKDKLAEIQSRLVAEKAKMNSALSATQREEIKLAIEAIKQELDECKHSTSILIKAL